MPSIATLQAAWNRAGGQFSGALSVGDADREALGRVIASEGYSGDKHVGWAAAAVGIGWSEVNRARYKNKSLYRSIAPYGDYGAQGTGGRQVASSQHPDIWEQAVADAIVARAVENNIGGAHHYFDPYVQDGGWQSGTALTYDAAGIVKRWHEHPDYQWAWIGNVDQLDPYALMFFRPEPDPAARESAKRAALAAVYEGRSRLYNDAKGRRRLRSVAYVAGGFLLPVLVGFGVTWWLLRR